MKKFFPVQRNSRGFDFFCAMSSAILLTLSFPQMNFFYLSWIGLIPLLVALKGKTLRQSWNVAYLTGLLFFWGTLYWFVHVTFIGAFFLLAYLSVYFGLFGVGYYFFARGKPAMRLFLLPCCWVLLEYARAHFLTGFGWASLGYSQYKNLWILQSADVSGVYGISFLIILVNVFLAEWLSIGRKNKNQLWILTGLVIGIMSVVIGYGVVRFDQYKPTGQGVQVAVVQGNVDQELKWSRTQWPMIMDQHMELTQQVAEKHPALIVWPETAFPGFLWEDAEDLRRVVTLAEKENVNILVGSIVHEVDDYYNSAVLVEANGHTDQVYHKLHRVPFGEFIPFRKYLPAIINDMIPIGDLTAGREHKIFHLTKDVFFATVICFEDTIDSLTREFTKHGAQFLVNITNDAWFKRSKSPYLHLQGSVFRAVENRRSLIRSANTGVSAIINRRGEIEGQIKDYQNNSIFVSGVLVGVVEQSSELTVYTKLGNIFVGLCAGFLVFGSLGLIKLNNN